jgi:preprotein translocase subunit SecG
MAWGTWYNPAVRTLAKHPVGVAKHPGGAVGRCDTLTEPTGWRATVQGFVLYMQLVQIIISIALIVVILVQAKGAGGLGGIFGGEGRGVYRTRRGVEKTLFNVTVGLATAFFFVSIASVIVF